MKKHLLHIILALGTVLLVGCGGGGGGSSDASNTVSLSDGGEGGSSDASDTVSSSGLSSEYDGIEEKAILTEDNYLKYVKAVNYLENLDWEDLPTSEDPMLGSGVTEDAHINENTGEGYVIVHYDDYQYKTEQIVNGTNRIDILDVKKTNEYVTLQSKMDLDIKLSTNDNNITFKMIANTTVKISEVDAEIISLTINKYHIYDQKNDEILEVVSDNTGDTDKLYIGSEGYVEFDTNDKNYTLIGENSTLLKLLFKAEEVIYQNDYTDTLRKVYSPVDGQGSIETILNNENNYTQYYTDLRVSQYEHLKFLESSYGYPYLYTFEFYKWSANYTFLNKDIENINVKIDWFINDVQVAPEIMYELPISVEQIHDEIKGVITATNGDNIVSKEVTLSQFESDFDYFYPRSPSTISINPKYRLDLEYESNDLTFDLDLLSLDIFDDIDINSSYFSWEIDIHKSGDSLVDFDEEGYPFPFDFKIIEGTENNSIVKVTAKRFGYFYEPLYLKVYTGSEVKVMRFYITLSQGNGGLIK